MIRKTEKLVITFYTTTEAMAMEQVCKSIFVDGRLIPVPPFISAGCGLAWCAKLESEEVLKEIMKTHEINPQGIYQCFV